MKFFAVIALFLGMSFSAFAGSKKGTCVLRLEHGRSKVVIPVSSEVITGDKSLMAKVCQERAYGVLRQWKKTGRPPVAGVTLKMESVVIHWVASRNWSWRWLRCLGLVWDMYRCAKTNGKYIYQGRILGTAI